MVLFVMEIMKSNINSPTLLLNMGFSVPVPNLLISG